MREAVPEMKAAGSRNPGIDALRGLAIVLVVFNHLGIRIPLEQSALADVLPTWLLNRLNWNGYEAVYVFFVISGFLIAGNTLRRWGSLAAIDARAFYARRFARIVPCLLALLVVLGALHLSGVQDYVIHRAGQSLPGALLSALGLHLNGYEGRTGYLPGSWDVLWSLSIEEAFYLGFPLACLLLRRRALLVPPLVLLALSLPWARAALHGNEIWLEKAYLPGMAAIATGVLGALLADACRPPRRTAAMLGWLGALGLGAVLLDGGALWHWLRDGYMLVLTLSALCLLLCCRWRAELGEVPPRRGLGWLRAWGRMSYEIYLTHMFVVFAVVRAYRAWDGDPARGWLWYLPALGLCWLLGLAVERWLSVPSGRWLQARLMGAGSCGRARVQAG
ncbi:acyltransferase family protein [Rhodanobacter geophilus]|uniref:Acyltransferase family protein n=1 Tax=Rhodanobacter geophilus TaxID=3162488 RepID=A0ABV3QN38_9GAMM